jgi:hypothetical protein
MRTLPPTVQNGPISTSSSISARLSTDARFEIVVAMGMAPISWIRKKHRGGIPKPGLPAFRITYIRTSLAAASVRRSDRIPAHPAKKPDG